MKSKLLTGLMLLAVASTGHAAWVPVTAADSPYTWNNGSYDKNGNAVYNATIVVDGDATIQLDDSVNLNYIQPNAHTLTFDFVKTSGSCYLTISKGPDSINKDFATGTYEQIFTNTGAAKGYISVANAYVLGEENVSERTYEWDSSAIKGATNVGTSGGLFTVQSNATMATSTLNVNASFSNKGTVSASSLNINKGTYTGDFTNDGDLSVTGNLTIASGAKFNHNSGTASVSSNTFVAGTLELSASMTTSWFHLGYNGTDIVDGAELIINKNGSINKESGKLNISFHGNSKLTLNDDASFYQISSSKGDSDKLTIHTNGYKLAINNIVEGNFYGDVDFYFDTISQCVENSIFFATSDKSLIQIGTIYIGKDAYDFGTTNKFELVKTTGGFYLNLSANVPELAEWAAIFGAIALGVAIYRRRK